MHTFTAMYYCGNGIPYINHAKVESDMSCRLEILTNRVWNFLTRITQTSTVTEYEVTRLSRNVGD